MTAAVLDPRTRGRKSDRKFFARRPDRRHRFRAAFRNEAESLGAPPPVAGSRYFMLARLMPGECIIAVPLPLPFTPEQAEHLSEAEAAALFDAAMDRLTDEVMLLVEAPMEAGAEAGR